VYVFVEIVTGEKSGSYRDYGRFSKCAFLLKN